MQVNLLMCMLDGLDEFMMREFLQTLACIEEDKIIRYFPIKKN